MGQCHSFSNKKRNRGSSLQLPLHAELKITLLGGHSSTITSRRAHNIWNICLLVNLLHQYSNLLRPSGSRNPDVFCLRITQSGRLLSLDHAVRKCFAFKRGPASFGTVARTHFFSQTEDKLWGLRASGPLPRLCLTNLAHRTPISYAHTLFSPMSAFMRRADTTVHWSRH